MVSVYEKPKKRTARIFQELMLLMMFLAGWLVNPALCAFEDAEGWLDSG